MAHEKQEWEQFLVGKKMAVGPLWPQKQHSGYCAGLELRVSVDDIYIPQFWPET
ncbi:uncharacterized protein ASCRUDRAFT_82288 [Ascoidea rubescens DSM 1968]|uniref:Uncharacterized protein n=1 Tax=Ascoidea rubescens DSM 1968 TaxID=1344418 RepID=A0A1D2VCU4_9ASCO|nr:hypothetical protein ASCRUDRAFT_82288 [Ascoidea rubescens DSM 1968]ODV59297.1 hypothetical protein ASCRUDRAFT_82288 [Ascoidea rubescens DSM 1968]